MKERINKLKTAVFEKTGQKIADNDPIFAVIAMNEAILDEYLAHATGDIQNAEQRLTEVIGLIEKAGDAYLTKKDVSLTAHRIQLDNDLIEANLEFKQNLGELISKHETAIETKFTTPVEEMLKTVQQSQHGLLKKMALFLLASLIGGAIGGVSMHLAADYWTTPKEQRDELSQEVEQLKQTLAKANTWGVTFFEYKDEKYIALPPGKKTGKTDLTIHDGKQNVIKIED